MSSGTDNINTVKDSKDMAITRRNLLKGLASFPVIGAFALGTWRKKRYEDLLRSNVQQAVDISGEAPVLSGSDKKDPVIRLGIIGYGGRGESLLRAAGFAVPQLLDNWKKAAALDSKNKRYEDFLAQEDLNIKVTAVCDVFDIRTENALKAAANPDREGTDGKFIPGAKKYKNYRELLRAEDVDAVIIATPDHWHAEMAIEAARNGKHVYLEKAMTRTVEETFRLRDAIKNNPVVFQLGHQGRQTESYMKAREAIEKDVLGKVSLIEVCTNRNDPNGAWVYKIHPEAGPHNIDWEHFEEPCENKHPFSLERFFRWRCWWDYGTGLAGDLLTHEYDAINQIMRLGIPYSAVSSGGVYFYKDKKAGHYVDEIRDVPDVWQAVLEYPERDLTLLYSATLANNKNRGKMIMGHDGYMEVDNNLTIYPDRSSTKYREKIEKGIIDPDLPIFTYIPGRSNVDAVATATEKYFASRGLMYTYRGGKRVDTTFLHIKEWIDCIRESLHSGNLIQPGCNIDEGFAEAITAHMATIAYRENRKVYWDAERQKVV